MPTTRFKRSHSVEMVALCIWIFGSITASAQIYMVEDINSGPDSSSIFRAGAFGSVIYFSANDGVHGEELWLSDGTAPGTYLVKDIWPISTTDGTGAYSSKPEQFIAGSSLMYFVAAHREDPDNLPNHEISLWMSNGQVENASIVPGFTMALSNSASDAVVMGGNLFIAGWDETYGIELWKINGSSASRVTDIEPGVGGSDPNDLTVVGSQLFFVGTNSATTGTELWVTDGTPGSESVIDIIPGTEGAWPRHLTAFDSKVFFAATTADAGMELWSSDGTPGGTSRVADIYSGIEDSGPLNLTPVGSQLFFSANDGINGRELWVTDGTEAGTQMVKDIVDDGSIGIWDAIAYDSKLFFVIDHPDSGKELWVSDGTESGTILFKDIYPGTYTVGEDIHPHSSEPAELTVANGLLFFSAADATHGRELWVSDGTSANTLMVADLFDYLLAEGPLELTATSNRLFFETNSDLGRELHALPTLNVVTPPAAPTGEVSGATETAYTYTTTGGSVSLKGGAVQYRFVWGDGEATEWLTEGVKSAEHTWTEDDTFEVTVEARSVTTPTVTSNSSSELSVVMSFSESVDGSVSDGPDTGELWVEYDFSLTGESTYDHDLEFRVNWGDGTSTDWAAFDSESGEVVTHDWDELGDFEIVVTLRCSDHTDVSDMVSHWITITEETINPPSIDGPSTGEIDVQYDFTVGGSSSAGHEMQYLVDWKDGSDTGWVDFGAGVTSAEVSHSWGSAETFAIEVGVRCKHHTDLAAWTDGTPIEISEPAEETIENLSIVGSTSGYIDASYGFTLSASSSKGHNLQYRVDWGDGNVIDWTAFGDGITEVQLSHAWDFADTHTMQFNVRCADHNEIEDGDIIEMFIDPEIVSEILLSGPSSGAAGVSADYVLTGRSASGHAMQYYMDWGHTGAQTGWLDINPATGTVDLAHAWPADGTYHLQFGARCKAHTGIEEWSETWVTILGETITAHTFSGPATGLVGVDLEYSVAGTSSDGHDLQYKFEWGDGFPTDWAALSSGSASQSYHWASPGEYTVKSSIRCTTHNHVLSEKEQLVTIAPGLPPGWIWGDGFESGDIEAW